MSEQTGKVEGVESGFPDHVMRYSPARDEEGFATGSLEPSDYGMWVSAVSVFRLKRELESKISSLQRELDVLLKRLGRDE